LSTESVRVPSIRSILQYLRLAGVLPVWRIVAWALLVIYAITVAALGVETNGAFLVMLICAPILAGSGLLTAAKEGRLDLLFGAGATRRWLWSILFTGFVVMPALLIGVYAYFFGTTHGFAAVGLAGSARAVVIAFATAAICFVVGLRKPGYTPGVIWSATRVAFLLFPGGRAIYARLASHEGGSPGVSDAIIGFFGFPEVYLDPNAPAWGLLLPFLLAGVLTVTSLRIFNRSDFGGHRTA
jgi:hypothetical protein